VAAALVPCKTRPRQNSFSARSTAFFVASNLSGTLCKTNYGDETISFQRVVEVTDGSFRNKKRNGLLPSRFLAGVRYLVRKRQGDSDDEEEERHDEVGHCYAVPRRVVQRRDECPGVIHDDHQLQQGKETFGLLLFEFV